MPWPWLVHGPVHCPFDAVQLSCPLSRKTPPKHNVSTSMFDGVLGVLGSIPPPPNTTSWVDAKELNFGLIWPQHFHPVLLWIIGKLQTGLYMCFLEQGDQSITRGFQSITAYCVTNCFLGDYGPSCLEIIDKILPLVLGWFLKVLMINETPRGEILHGAPVRGRLTVILCFFHLWIIAPTVVTFSSSCLAMVL